MSKLLILAVLISGFIFALLPISSRAQHKAGDASYFPLGDGNRWSYYEVIDPPRSAPDTVSIGSFAVEELFQRNGYSYYEWRRDTIRVDDKGNIWRYNDEGSDALWFDFTKADSTTYEYKDPDMNRGTTSYPYTVSVSRNDAIAVEAGSYANTITFSFELPRVLDADYSYTFAAGVGPIRISEAPGPQVMYLDTAWVDGKTITARQKAPQAPASLRLEPNFPDPFQAQTTIPYHLPRTGRVCIAVYDVLGRHVATVMNQTQSPGRHSVVFDSDDLPGGAYFYRIAFGTQIRTGRMVVVK